MSVRLRRAATFLHKASGIYLLMEISLRNVKISSPVFQTLLQNHLHPSQAYYLRFPSGLPTEFSNPPGPTWQIPENTIHGSRQIQLLLEYFLFNSDRFIFMTNPYLFLRFL